MGQIMIFMWKHIRLPSNGVRNCSSQVSLVQAHVYDHPSSFKDIDSETLSTRIGVPDGDLASLSVSYSTDFGHDCDGNCRYDGLLW